MERRTRLAIPALEPIWSGLAGLSWPIVRITAGVMLIPHGFAKLFQGGLSGTAQFMSQMGLEPANTLAIYIALLEFVGGILLAAGFLTRVVAVQVVGFMVVAAFYVHWGNGFFWADGGWEYPAFWGLVALAILFRGAGRYSIDRAIGWEF